jgi:hypothetical protein
MLAVVVAAAGMLSSSAGVEFKSTGRGQSRSWGRSTTPESGVGSGDGDVTELVHTFHANDYSIPQVRATAVKEIQIMKVLRYYTVTYD